MSNKTQLSTNNERLSSLIQELQGKAAGGGSVETCTVTVTTTGNYPARVKLGTHITYDGEIHFAWCNGLVDSEIEILHSSAIGSYVINNVLVWSMLHLQATGSAASLTRWIKREGVENLTGGTENNPSQYFKVLGDAYLEVTVEPEPEPT